MVETLVPIVVLFLYHSLDLDLPTPNNRLAPRTMPKLRLRVLPNNPADRLLMLTALCSGVSLLFIILINIAGNGFHRSTSSGRYNSTALANLHVIEVSHLPRTLSIKGTNCSYRM